MIHLSSLRKLLIVTLTFAAAPLSPSLASEVDDACKDHPQTGDAKKDDAIVVKSWSWTNWGQKANGKYGPIATAPVHMETPSADTLLTTTPKTRDAVIKKLGELKPALPFYPPARVPGVFNVEGWNYSFEPSYHNAVDIAYPILNDTTHEFDNTFPVLAVADGTVIWVGFQPGSGNTIILEHRAPDGTIYHSFYDHLRNGRSSDIEKTLWFKDMPNLTSNASLNGKYTDAVIDKQAIDDAVAKGKPVPSAVLRRWGDDTTKLEVATGQTVRAWQRIAWAGMTGNQMKGNHLHFMIGRVVGTDTSRSVLFDPFGNYGAGGYKGPCYKLPLDTNKPFPYDDHPMGRMGSAVGGKVHPKFFAPVFHTFVRSSFEDLVAADSYFSALDMSPTTIAVGRNAAGAVRYSGAFEKNGDSGRGVFLAGLQTASMNAKLTSLRSDAAWFYNVKRIVSIFVDGKPQHTALWLKQKRAPTGSTAGKAQTASQNEARINMSLIEFASNDRDLRSKGYMLVDFDVYAAPSTGTDGPLFFNAVWAPGTLAGESDHRLTIAQVAEKNDVMLRKGMQLKRVVMVNGLYSALWLQTGKRGNLVRVKESEVYDRLFDIVYPKERVVDIQHIPYSGPQDGYLLVTEPVHTGPPPR